MRLVSRDMDLCFRSATLVTLSSHLIAKIFRRQLAGRLASMAVAAALFAGGFCSKLRSTLSMAASSRCVSSVLRVSLRTKAKV